ncbi:MAG: gliding motility protein GldL [Bacteroidales bacterium]|nr:gliding motility protein GldL [Bacteroidales bacterium]
MTLSELVQSSGWKNFMAKLYGFGASVVIIGAMFKIMHWPGAGIMIVAGLSTEAIIFFFSAFEPLHEEVDWTLVYPELAGITDDDEMENFKESITSSRGNVVLEKFENLFDQSTLTPETLEKLSEGFAKLNNTVSGLADISEATAATKAFATNFQTAAQSLDSLTSLYSESSNNLANSISALSNTYQKTAQIIEQTGQKVSEQVQESGMNMANAYQKLAESISVYSSAMTSGSQTYTGQVEKLNKNLSELNALYELQLRETSDYLKKNQTLYSGMDNILANLNESVNETKRYREEMSKLSENLAALNNIYGNMLSAMNYTKK